MTRMTGFSRGLLSCKNLHVRSNIHNLGRGLSRTSTKRPERYSFQLNSRREIVSLSNPPYRAITIGRESIPWSKDRAGPQQTAGGGRRGLANQIETPTDSDSRSTLYSDFTTGTNTPTIQLVNDTTISLGIPGQEEPVVLDRHWLRDACECSQCVDPDSGQKNFGTCDVPTELPIQEISRTEDGGLQVVWKNDFLSSGDHVSRYSDVVFQSPRRIVLDLPTRTLWDKATLERDRLTIDYDEWISGKDGFLSGLHRLHTHGIIFLRNVPSSEESVVSIANQIGNLQETFYGRTWDVRSKPSAENVAYTSSFLGLHQDLLYVRDSPRIQILHCIENTCEGGDSMFSDGVRAGHLMKLGPQHVFDNMTKRLIRYKYDKNGHHYQNTHPVLNEDLNVVHWSPPFQALRQRVSKSEKGSTYYRKWLRTATKFRQLLEEEHWMYRYKMKPGECVLFDNKRVLHGRQAFDAAGGSRWLKGAYIAGDVFRSKLSTLSEQLLAFSEGNEVPLGEQAMRYQEEHNIWVRPRIRD